MILAQYTIRSKQEYIFKTNRVLEIIGASENIANIWDELFKVAEEKQLKFERLSNEFDMKAVQSKFSDGSLNFVELFCGGGNETILFDSDIKRDENGESKSIDETSSFFKLNRAFSYMLITKYPGMIPMVAYVELTGNYSEDYKKLMEESDRKKNIMEPIWNMFTVPFAMMDRSTFQPYSHKKNIGGNFVRMSDESNGKYEVGQRLRNKNDDIRLFDEMVTRKGKESLLAVVHADGNNMGTKIMGMLSNESDYDKAVRLMRNFTKITADCFEIKGEEALRNCRNKLEEDNKRFIQEGKLKKSSLSYRKIIGSGDDMTFICNARFVMDYVQAYLSSVQSYQEKYNSDWAYSSCAGICIFHSHYPFSRAYSIAEQACDDGAKEKVHISDADGKPIVLEQGWMDFHFIHNGIGGNLEEISESQETKAFIARPWLLAYSPEDANAKSVKYKYEDLLKLKKIFEKKRNQNGNEDERNGTKVSRSAIKTIGSAYERSEAAAKKELTSLYGHTPGLEDDIKKIYREEKDFLKALYDFAEIYDLWYAGVK